MGAASTATTAPAVAVVNLGCRVNRVESDRIAADLARAGLELTDEASAALVVINTCAVTGEAEAKTRKAVRRAANLPQEPIVLVTGCVVNLHAEELCALSPRVVAEPSKAGVAARACEALGWEPLAAESTGEGAADTALAHGATPSSKDGHTLLGRSRPGVKIQDGCNHRCSYCIVWKARGPERSLPVGEVLERVRAAEAAGAPEIVLTGVNLGAYRAEGPSGERVEIGALLRAILGETGIPRVRLSSIEPMDVDARLLDAMAAGGGRVAPFLHLPVQSGCTETLRRMNRPYTAGELLELVEGIRERVPAAALSADVIVGFPGETDDEFRQSLDLCERIGFSRMHVFRYSKRPGTPAATMPDQVPPQVMAERSAAMRSLANRMAHADAARRVGTTESAVLEHGNQGTLGSFHRVRVQGSEDMPPASLVNVAIIGVDDDGVLIGTLTR